jgi:tetratricopeptide (TPR) repeat protein
MQETISRLLLNLGNLSVGRSDYARAREYYTEARELALRVGDTQGASAALTNLGVMAKADGDYVAARQILDESLALKREMGDGRGIAVVLQGLADIDRFEGRFASSQRLMQESLTLSRDLEFSMGMILGLETVAALLAEIGLPSEGLRLAAAADAARTATGQKRSTEDATEFDRAVTRLRALADEGAQTPWDEGLTLSLADAVERVAALPVPDAGHG